jgi:endonuclease-3
MTLQKKAAEVVRRLKALYPEVNCTLDFRNDYELLFSARLAAQCTDARVNTVTPLLFSRYPTLEALAEAEISDLEAMVRPCGFFRTKARDIRGAARLLLERHNGRVPGTMNELLALPGVGRKTANLILGDVYGLPAVVADTHCIRISNKTGLCTSKDPKKVEEQLRAIVAPVEQNDLCHRFVFHGRAVCRAKKPDCQGCVLRDVCTYAISPSTSARSASNPLTVSSKIE